MTETLSRMLLHILKTYPKDNLLMHKKEGHYIPISTQEFGDMVKYFSLGLKSLGVESGDKLVILGDNGPYWVMADYANLCLGGITVPIYPSLVPQQIKYIINDSDAKVVVCSSRELWQKVQAVKNELTTAHHFITFEQQAPEGVLPLENILEKGKSLDGENKGIFENLALSVQSDDLASIIYTSGTTGIPKGVMLTHNNFVSNIKTLDSIIDFNVNDTILSFLPLSHVLERMVTFAFLYKGCSIAYAESVETVAENLLETRPTILVSVPRLFEKIYSKVVHNVLASSNLKKKIFFWALRVGKEYGQKKINGVPISKGLQFRRNFAHKLVFSKILERTGGRIKFFVSGGAPLSRDIAEFFFALGLVILEGYGLTETSPVLAVNSFENLRFGTVGKPIPGIEVKIAPDGEILAKGPNVMRGYYKQDAETKEVFEGGWFHTGDIGYLDRNGFLVITDRKKDLIITAGGKNVAPQPIENLLKQSPFIANAVVVGGSRKFISALIVPNFEKLEEYARLNQILYENPKDLIKKEQIVRHLLKEVDQCTPHLAPFEKVRKIALLDREFEIEEGEMTPTLKVKRNIVEEKYKDVIGSLYRD